MVFDQSNYRGTGDLLDGPGRWATLDALRDTRQDSWRNRIRSLRTGQTATLTVYTDENFKGDVHRYAPQTSLPQLDASISARIESLELNCGADPNLDSQ